MTEVISVEAAAKDLQDLVGRLQMGDTLTLVDGEGTPVAVLVSVKPAQPREKATSAGWIARWDDLSRRISEAWQGNRSALEILSEMRR